MNNFSKIKRTIAFAVVLMLIFNSCGKPPSAPASTTEPKLTMQEETSAEVIEPVIDTPIFSKVSAVKIRYSEGIARPLYSNATGIHGGHESRIVRTETGTFAVYITAEYSDETYDFTWDEFSVVKINDGVDELIFRDRYPHAMGSCAPNILCGKDGKIYVTVIADDKPKYYSANYSREGAWLRIYVIDPVTYEVQTYAHNPDFEIIWVHGYGYSQPILDEDAGKLYALFTGGDIPGYLAWFIFDLESKTWNPECYTVQTHSRIAYFNAYPDGNGGFYFIAERAVLADELGKFLGVTFEPSGGYIWDALYLCQIPDATTEHVELTSISEYPYQSGMTISRPTAVHYGSGCSYLDKNGTLHLIYSYFYGDERSVYYVRYDKNLNLIEKRLLEIDHTEYTFAMAEGIGGDLYIIGADTRTEKKRAEINIWRTKNGGDSYEHFHHQSKLTENSGRMVGWFYKLNASSPRNGSLTDGTVDLLFFDEDNLYYHFSVTLP
ncbi:MAG: hypothetical protein J6S71_08725 [Clostridia bacterium]|nr:hypothetical protein [Clostridia bacterium]